MGAWLKKILSHEAGPFWQFVKYGVIGVLSTCVQTAIFYLLAATCLKCLTPDDWAVRFLGLSAATFTGHEAWYASRGTLAAADTGCGFVVANIFCWLMNRWFVFVPGKYRWTVELGMFFGVSTVATVVALCVMKVLIDCAGMMTSLAVFVEVAVSFLMNFFARKFVIFKR
jgi:putative flippase GtrA